MLDCEAVGSLNLEVIRIFVGGVYHYNTASNVLISDEDKYWNADSTFEKGFTVKVDCCARWIGRVQIKNRGGVSTGYRPTQKTRKFKVHGAKKRYGPWDLLVEDELEDIETPSLINYYFGISGNPIGKPEKLEYEKITGEFTDYYRVKLKYLRFELVSYWGDLGGGRFSFLFDGNPENYL